uniref:Uncharacterized protein n=1 Tax=Anopheles darlingi TaxID=43151 RepID=A0A2M4D2L6_ANODA
MIFGWCRGAGASLLLRLVGWLVGWVEALDALFAFWGSVSCIPLELHIFFFFIIILLISGSNTVAKRRWKEMHQQGRRQWRGR